MFHGLLHRGLFYERPTRKTIITQKVHVTQSSNIIHCDWHTQKLICADFQAFSNTFSLYKLTFFHFCQGEFSKQPKFTFCWFWLVKMHQNGLSGTYLGFKVCQIQWQRFWVSTISGSWKIKFQAEISRFVDFDWEKCIEIAWVVHI